MSRAYFITGTDTGVGKTSVAVALLQAAAKRGLSTAAVKPVAAGCERSNEGLRNDDALQLQQACTITLTYEQINPFALQPAIAPHFAAAREGLQLDAKQLADHCQSILNLKADLKADFTVIEGAGGWLVPLNETESMADVPKAFGLDIILVVGMRLGCLNHALLTAAAIEQNGNHLVGWVANIIDPSMLMIEKNILTLKKSIKAPLLGTLPHMDTKEIDAASQKLEVGFLLELSKSNYR